MSTTTLKSTPGGFLQRQNRRVAMRAVPAVLMQRFDPVAAEGLTTAFELRVTEPGGSGVEERFGLAIVDGALTVTRGGAPDAVAWIAISLRDMLALVEGTTALWPLMAAKRLDLGGEPFTALRFPALFGF